MSMKVITYFAIFVLVFGLVFFSGCIQEEVQEDNGTVEQEDQDELDNDESEEQEEEDGSTEQENQNELDDESEDQGEEQEGVDEEDEQEEEQVITLPEEPQEPEYPGEQYEEDEDYFDQDDGYYGDEFDDPNLIAFWMFNGVGDTVVDSINGYEGTIVGATRVDGKLGGALYFDGEDDYVEFSQETMEAIGELEQGTIAFMFKFESLLDSQTVMPIFYIGVDDEGDEDNMFIIEMGHSDTDTAAIDPNNKKIYTTWIKNNEWPFLCFDSNENLNENEWYHFAVTVGPDGNTGYLNGVEMDNRHYSFGDSGDTAFLDDIPVKEIFTLGYGKTHYMVSDDFVYYKGYLDGLRIYNKPLTSSEIADLTENN